VIPSASKAWKPFQNPVQELNLPLLTVFRAIVIAYSLTLRPLSAD
jgi:hypothetical protein